MKANNELIGKRFGRLIVLEAAEPDITNKRKWLCKCDCGKEKIIYEQSFCRGATKSCGCYSKELSRSRMSKGWAEIITKEFLIENHIKNKLSLREIGRQLGCSVSCVEKYLDKFNLTANDPFYDIVGLKFNKLYVVSFAHTLNGASYFNVKCDCGVEKPVQGKSLARNSIVSCGCWNREKCWKGCGDLSKSYWNTIVKGAIRRNIEFSIDIFYGWELFQKQNGICALSGNKIVLDRSISQTYRKIHLPKIQTASLDRINSTLGYVQGNVQWIHMDVNRMKMNLDENKFIQLCKDIAKNNP